MAALTGCSAVSSVMGGSSYQPELKSAVVSTPAIGQSGTLRVGVDTEKAPLAGVDSSQNIIGIDVDVAAALADELGLKLSIVDVGSDPEGALADGKVDLVMGIDSLDSSGLNMWFSENYLPTGVALIALSSQNASVPTAQSSLQIAAQISSTSAWAVDNEFGESALVSVKNLSDAFSQLESGKVGYVAADAVIGAYAAHRQEIDADVVALMTNLGGYCIGISKSNTQLQTAVSDALSKLVDGGVVDVVESKWFGSVLDLASTPKTAGASSNVQGSDSAESGADADAAEGNAAEGDAAADGASSDGAAVAVASQ